MLAFFTDVDHFTAFTHEISRFATLGLLPLFELIVSRRDILEAYKWSREYLFNSLRERGIDTTRLTIAGGLLSCGTGYGMTPVDPFFDQSDRELHRAFHEILVEFLEQARPRSMLSMSVPFAPTADKCVGH